MSTTMHVYAGNNRTGFEDAGTPARAYVRRTKDRSGQEAAAAAAHRCAAALMVAASHPAWPRHRRIEPAVLDDADADDIDVVLPTGDDGAIVFVSETPIRALERWARLPDEGHDYQVVDLQAGAGA